MLTLLFDLLNANIETFLVKSYRIKAIILLYLFLKSKVNPPQNFTSKFYIIIKRIVKEEYPENSQNMIINQISISNSYEELLQKEINFDEFQQIYSNDQIDRKILLSKYKLEEQILNLLHENIITNIYNIAIISSVKSLQLIREFSNIININTRNLENTYSIIQMFEMCSKSFTSKPKSFRISPFVSSTNICRKIILPSIFPIKTPNDSTAQETIKPNSTKYSFMHFKAIIEEYPSYLPKDLFKYSQIFQCVSVLQLFSNVFPGYNQIIPCKIIRFDLNVPSIIFKYENSFRILLNCNYKNNDIELLPNLLVNLIESILLGELGQYSMFCGHFVLIIQNFNIISLLPYNYASIQTCYELTTETFGSFIIQTNKFKILPEIKQKNFPSLSIVMNDWINGKISNFEYIKFVNLFAGRSFSDLCSYPIFPKVIKDYQNDVLTFDNNLRDFNYPIGSVFNHNDQLIIRRYEMSKFHHSENISNPLTVSGTLIRILPFCRIQWFINKGWDIKERNFFSIPLDFSLNCTTKYEFIPEVYCFPEMFLNLNNFVFPDNQPYDVKMPKWASDPFKFVELHKYILEDEKVRKNLNVWFDLVFGVLNFGNEAISHLNTFSELSYQEPNCSQERRAQKHLWMTQCGQLPNFIFDSKHPISKSIQNNFNAKYVLKYSMAYSNFNPSKINVNYSKIAAELTVSIDEMFCDISFPSFEFINDVTVSDDLIAVTTAVSTVYIMKAIVSNETLTLKGQIQFHMRNPLFSYIYRKFMLCLTVNNKEILIWSISSGFKICSIGIKNVELVRVDKETDALFVASGNILYQYTLNGTFIRKIDVGAKITALDTASFGFTVFTRPVVVGLVDGNVLLVNVSLDKGEFTVGERAKVSSKPIKGLNVLPESSLIEVFDK